MITQSKHVEAVIRKHWSELIGGRDVDRRLQQRLLPPSRLTPTQAMSTLSTTHDQEMTKQLAINLYNGVCGTLHAIGGTHCPSNILPPQPHKVRSDGIYKCLTGHYHKISSRNIFRGFREQAIIVISDG